ncbi:6001_t:CDS:2 [Ambispora gerdemannii]|uniref:6001_t:CDS:1 n=1 Tax=Ambispora gerdemannii TaxID=144530 RepID=A0A9N8V136_9GLOM|nr:6001_t:CDS:2 [Ambispora gerdemannii]
MTENKKHLFGPLAIRNGGVLIFEIFKFAPPNQKYSNEKHNLSYFSKVEGFMFWDFKNTFD